MHIKPSSVKNRNYAKHYKAAILWAAFVLFISLVPGTQIAKVDFWNFDVRDKVAHILLYFVLGCLLIYGSYKRTRFQRPAWVYLLVFPVLVSAFGGMTEFLQGYCTTTRYASIGDALANIIGAFAGTTIAFVFFKKLKKQDCPFKYQDVN